MKKIPILTFLLILLVLSNSLAQQGHEICRENKQHVKRSPGVIEKMQATDYRLYHIDLHIDSILFTGQQIYGRAKMNFLAESAPFSTARIDLLGFTIDSIFSPTHTVTYSYNDTVIDLQFSPSVSLNDSVAVWIHYHGNPKQDASGWGGFYFSGSYAFNLGVGFQADPHNYGRAWFPCIDNFVSRNTFDFYITTAGTSKAFCNGTLQGSVLNPNGSITWHWKMNQTIPSYLASMAVAPYYTLNRTSNGIPVQWAALPSDTNAVLLTFSNLDTTLAAFIDTYGPYSFDKVGYCLVPFNSGAMEHASSIHIGRAFVNGSQTYATLWAHELAHMWWGDKVTCETAEDMWLNEGFASYNEAFYTRIVSGENAYRDWIRTNHRKVLQFAHTPAQDGSYLTLNQIPHDYTYGYHVYQKGANIVHSMRNYMGDQEFKNGCQAYMNNRAFNHANSYDLRDELTAGSGVDMTRFFDDWVFTPGFPHFSIDSVVYWPGGLDHYFIYTRQRTKGNNNHLYEMPVEINFTDGVIDTTVTVVIDSVTNMFHIPLYYAPTWIVLDRWGKVSDARVANEKLITNTGSQLIAETNVTLNVQTVGSPQSLVRIEHHFVAPDPFLGSNPGIRLSDYHYWKVDGMIQPGFLSKGTFVYDGSVSVTTGYLDNTLITGSEDSLVLLYRPGPGYEWNVVTTFTRNTGPNVNDKKGSITVDTLITGEYTLGYIDYSVGENELIENNSSSIRISPNPSKDIFTITLSERTKADDRILIIDSGGRTAHHIDINENSTEVFWNCNWKGPGIYYLVWSRGTKKLGAAKMMIAR
jgi:hypothetical protein